MTPSKDPSDLKAALEVIFGEDKVRGRFGEYWTNFKKSPLIKIESGEQHQRDQVVALLKELDCVKEVSAVRRRTSGLPYSLHVTFHMENAGQQAAIFQQIENHAKALEEALNAPAPEPEKRDVIPGFRVGGAGLTIRGKGLITLGAPETSASAENFQYIRPLSKMPPERLAKEHSKNPKQLSAISPQLGPLAQILSAVLMVGFSLDDMTITKDGEFEAIPTPEDPLALGYDVDQAISDGRIPDKAHDHVFNSHTGQVETRPAGYVKGILDNDGIEKLAKEGITAATFRATDSPTYQELWSEELHEIIEKAIENATTVGRARF